MGWPVHVWGCVNEDGEFGVSALALTSTVTKEHVMSAMSRWQDASIAVSIDSRSKKLFGMSDAEDAYRSTFQELHAAKSMMCYLVLIMRALHYNIK